MSSDADWDELLDIEAEITVIDEQFTYRALGQINMIADKAQGTLPADLRRPLLAIMAYAQEARRRLIDG